MERVGDQHLQVVAPANDVDPFAGQLVNDVLDAVPADADAGPHAVDALVGAADGDLRAVTRLARLGLDFNHAVADFRDLLLEQALDQGRANSAEDDLDARALLADLADGGAHAFVVVVRFAGNLLALGQDCLGVSKGYRRGAPLVALDDTGHELVAQFVVLFVERVALRLANPLDHDLLGGLSADPLCHFGRIHGGPVARPGDRTIGAVDLDNDLLIFAEVLLRRRDQGRLDSLEDDFFIDVFVAVDRVNDPQHFARVHRVSLSLPTIGGVTPMQERTIPGNPPLAAGYREATALTI